MTMEHIERSFKVSLHIDHPSIDPDEISRQLGLVPSRQHLVGTPRKTKKSPSLIGNFETSHWMHAFDLKGVSDLSEFLPSIIQRLSPHAAFLKSLTSEGGRIDLLCGLWADGNWDENFPHQLLRDLSALSIDLRLDVYPKRTEVA